MTFNEDIAARLEQLKAEGLYKTEAPIASPQQGEVVLEDGSRMFVETF